MSTGMGKLDTPAGHPVADHYVRVRAVKAVDNQDGTWSLVVQGRMLTGIEKVLLDELFPHHKKQVSEMLRTEIVMGAVIQDED